MFTKKSAMNSSWILFLTIDSSIPHVSIINYKKNIISILHILDDDRIYAKPIPETQNNYPGFDYVLLEPGSTGGSLRLCSRRDYKEL